MKTFLEKLLFPDAAVNKARLTDTIAGKTIVITGASYGIGRELALLFSAYKVHLVIIARTEDKLREVAATVTKNGSACRVVAADLYQESGVELVIETLNSLPGGIDLFISNAGKSITRPLAQSLDRYHDFTRTNALNYLAPVRMLLAATPLLNLGGQIINVSALNVLLLPAPTWAAYQASKTAFDQWMRSNLAEWKIMGIAAKTIYLPLVRTRMITPTERYKNQPTMQPEQAAIRVAKLIYIKGNYSKPWWAVFAQTASFLSKSLWEKLSFFRLNKRSSRDT
ncbi:MAG: SDR family NAD(P)-dependent oxidoreductase [Bacteroidota bacterium]